MSEQELIVARGIPASGKSTYAVQWVAEDPTNRVRINRDDLRMELFNTWMPLDAKGFPDKNKEAQVTNLEHKRIAEALRNGKSVIVDNTHLSNKPILQLRRIAAQHNVPVRNKDFPITLEEAKRRNSLRDRKVPDHVIANMFKRLGPGGQFSHFDGTHPVKPLSLPNSRKQAIAFDMDGTLTDVSPIRHFIDAAKGKGFRDFDSFHRMSVHCPANDEVLDMAMDAHRNGFTIIITTARNEAYREATQKWLDDYGIPFENIFMRKDGDMRPDYVVKKEMYETQIKPYYDVLRAVDDNPQAVQNWKEQGLQVTEIPFGSSNPKNINNVFRKGGCVRCGKPLKSGALIGPRCAQMQ